MKKFIVGLMAIALLSCGQKKGIELKESESLLQENQESVPSKDLYSDGRSKMVKTANCRFQVADMKKGKENMVASIKKYSAYVESSNLEYQSPMLEEHITIRVLNDYFENLLEELTSQAIYVNYKKVDADDVSKEFVDLESRLKTKREVQMRYEDILRRKTGSIDEVLKAEKQIGELQEEIDAAEGQLNFLKEKVRYSTIKLEIYQIAEQQVAKFKIEPDYSNKFLTAFVAGWTGLTNVLVGITYLWPIAVAASIVWYISMRRRKRGLKHI